jgi:TonB family protein
VERSSDPRPGEPTDLALRDDLTGAWNRRYLRQLLHEDWAELVASHGTVTLLVLDLDFFKEINDTHGHLAGDIVLQRASHQLRASFRAEDRLIRYGGDEFVVALFGAGAEEARALAERARMALQEVEVPAPRGGAPMALPVSFSMGVASHPTDGVSGEAILAIADQRLYEEKRARRSAAPASADRGRKRILLASGLAMAVLALVVWFGLRQLREAPPPPADLSSSAGPVAPPTEIVVRDEEELSRLREEVRRLQTVLADSRAADDRRLFEARIRELEARLSEAGDESARATEPSAAEVPGAPGTVGSAGSVGGIGAIGAIEGTGGMRIGERRTRENLVAAGSALPAAETAPGSAPAPPAPEATPAAGAVPVVEPPRLLRAIRPAYPRIARERRRAATVELSVRVDAEGRVLAVESVGPPAGFGFDESAREAALSAQFRPGRRDGVAVEMETRLAIRFLLEGPPR